MGKITIKEIANICNVSKSTVSYAFNHPQKISKEMKDKILNVAIENGYFKNNQLTYKKIMVIFNDLEKNFYHSFNKDIIFGIMDEVSNNELDLRIINGFNIDYEQIYKSDGIIFCGHANEEIVNKIEKIKIPYIIAGDYRNKEYNTITAELTGGYRSIIEYVIQLGHKNIALLMGGCHSDLESTQLYEVFSSTLNEFEIEINNDYIHYIPEGDTNSSGIALHKLLNCNPKPTAIITIDDDIAYQVWEEAEKHKIQIPEEISLTGYAEIERPYFCKPLTTVKINKKEIGKRSVQMLLESIKLGKPIGSESIHTELVLKDSVKRSK